MTDVPAVAAEFSACLALADSGAGDRRLVSLLSALGFLTPLRSVANLRLLALLFPPELLAEITLAARAAAAPDQALNGLERISAAVSHEDLLAVCTCPEPQARLLTILGASPFLTTLFCRNPGSFHELFLVGRINVTGCYHESLARLRALAEDVRDYQELFPLLRRFKYAEVARIAGRDLNGMASLEETTGELADLASVSLQIAYEVCRRILVLEYGVPLMRTVAGETEADLVILGMGKLGGRELNFSSDIDLIYFYSSDDGETAGVPQADGTVKGRISLHVFFVKLAELISKAISQVTEDGFVFRVDLGLRPEGKSGDLALSLRSAEVYYEAWGQSWERSAMLKAWPVAGSLDLGEQFLRMIEPFVYRKYLDYTLVEDMMAMKKKIDLSLAGTRAVKATSSWAGAASARSNSSSRRCSWSLPARILPCASETRCRLFSRCAMPT
jgi:[glutamine synthetase] adenylyltransferase / [glutamine synthetase]-adenylyl-L-tyrosine phosphorylase